jgi:hypothetical protein
MTTEWQLTIDCADPAPLVRFWSLALGYVPLEPPNGLPTWRAWYLSIGVPEEELGEGDCTDRLRDPEGQRVLRRVSEALLHSGQHWRPQSESNRRASVLQAEPLTVRAYGHVVRALFVSCPRTDSNRRPRHSDRRALLR